MPDTISLDIFSYLFGLSNGILLAIAAYMIFVFTAQEED